MRVLHLTLKKKWFDRVGVDKWEEYRDSSKWILSRLYHRNGIPKTYDIIQFRNGYRKDSPVKRFKFDGFNFRVGKIELGASGHHQYIIKFSTLSPVADAIEAIRSLIVPTGQFSSATTYAANTAYENAIKELEKLKK